MYHIRDNKYENRLVFLPNNREVQFHNHEAMVDDETAYFISRIWPNEYKIDLDHFVAFDKDSWKDKRLIWSCNYASANGYGCVAENTVKYLLLKGYDVLNPGSISNNMVSGGELVDPMLEKTLNKPINPNCIEIQHCQPPAFRKNIVEKSWLYTMFETDHTPQDWIRTMNQAEVVMTPSSWIIPYWKDQGVKRPMEVYPHGIDPDKYVYMDRPEREVFTFLHYGELAPRKGSELVGRAFREEFGEDKRVRLVLKNTKPCFPLDLSVLHQSNVITICATYDYPQLRKMLFEADCLVSPSRGEGFSLVPLEAAATGLPVITTNWSGMTDYATKDDFMLCDYDMVRAKNMDDIYKYCLGNGENTGNWAEPKLEDIKKYMRWAFEHQQEAKEMGKKASNRIQSKWTWSKAVEKLVKIISKYY